MKKEVCRQQTKKQEKESHVLEGKHLTAEGVAVATTMKPLTKRKPRQEEKAEKHLTAAAKG
jgi:hypothetical protein